MEICISLPRTTSISNEKIYRFKDILFYPENAI